MKLLREAKSEPVRLKAVELVLNTVGLNQGKDNYQELIPTKLKKAPTGQYSLDKITEGLGVQ